MDVRVRRRSGQCRRSPDEAIVRAAREGAGDDCLLMVDAGASNTFWPHGLKWALRTADMVKEYDAYWLEEASERVRGGGERAAGCSGAAWGCSGAALPNLVIALMRRLRCPSGTQNFSRSASVSSGRTSASISCSRKVASYWPRPISFSHSPTSMAALHMAWWDNGSLVGTNGGKVISRKNTTRRLERDQKTTATNSYYQR
jgi:hypothetical protein